MEQGRFFRLLMRDCVQILTPSKLECLMIVVLWCAHPDRGLRASVRQAIQALNFEAAMSNLPPKMPVPMYTYAGSKLR